MSRDRMAEPRYRLNSSIRRRITVDSLLLAGVMAITFGLATVALKAGPTKDTRTNSEKSTPDPSENLQQADKFSPLEIIDHNLRKPNSPLLSDLRDMHDRSGLTAQFLDCSDNIFSIDNTVINPVTLRESPTRTSRNIGGELIPGEQFTAPIEVVVSNLYRVASTERWLAKIEGTDLTFAAREDANRKYIVRNWPDSSSCRPLQIPYDYLKTNPDLVQPK